VDKVKAEWAERIEMDAAIPVKKGQSSIIAAAKAAKKPPSAH
jgi:hypothetical protein